MPEQFSPEPEESEVTDTPERLIELAGLARDERDLEAAETDHLNVPLSAGDARRELAEIYTAAPLEQLEPAAIKVENPVESFPEFADGASRTDALRTVVRAAYSLFVTPKHEKLHQDVARMADNEPPQPLQPSIEETIEQIEAEVLAKADLTKVPTANWRRLGQLAGTLIQFTDYLPVLHEKLSVPYEKIADLRDAVERRASENDRPLNFAEQLDVALGETNGDVTDALWRLVMTPRLHSRWLDGAAIEELPDYSREEKVQLMLTWQRSLAACKEPSRDLPQDASGDTYYTWTHALAKVAYSLAPDKSTRTTRTAVGVFHRGTKLMHTLVHTINKQGVRSDHTIAAAYGNAFGQACVDAMRPSKS